MASLRKLPEIWEVRLAGSVGRGTSTNTSDIDVQVVLDPTSDTYKTWLTSACDLESAAARHRGSLVSLRVARILGFDSDLRSSCPNLEQRIATECMLAMPNIRTSGLGPNGEVWLDPSVQAGFFRILIQALNEALSMQPVGDILASVAQYTELGQASLGILPEHPKLAVVVPICLSSRAGRTLTFTTCDFMPITPVGDCDPHVYYLYRALPPCIEKADLRIWPERLQRAAEQWGSKEVPLRDLISVVKVWKTCKQGKATLDASCMDALGMTSDWLVEHDAICDYCDATPIRGTRYKCQECENYDLCGACFAKRSDFGHLHDFGVIEMPQSIWTLERMIWSFHFKSFGLETLIVALSEQHGSQCVPASWVSALAWVFSGLLKYATCELPLPGTADSEFDELHLYFCEHEVDIIRDAAAACQRMVKLEQSGDHTGTAQCLKELFQPFRIPADFVLNIDTDRFKAARDGHCSKLSRERLERMLHPSLVMEQARAVISAEVENMIVPPGAIEAGAIEAALAREIFDTRDRSERWRVRELFAEARVVRPQSPSRSSSGGA